MLVITSAPNGTTNGGARHFFETVGEQAWSIALPTLATPDPVALTKAAADHGIEILPPR
jgi:hypothetical protein